MQKKEYVNNYDLLEIQKIKLITSLESQEHTEIRAGQAPFGRSLRMNLNNMIGRGLLPEDHTREDEYLRGFDMED